MAALTSDPSGWESRRQAGFDGRRGNVRTSFTWVQTTLAVLLSACAGPSGGLGGDPSAPASAPDWVRRGSRVESGVIYGLGSAEGIGNTSLARSTAANRGRAEIAKILQVYSASLMKDYQASTLAGGMSSEEQRVEQAIKTYSDGLLNGSEVRDYWLDARTNTWYALVVLDYERAETAASLRAKMGGGLSEWVQSHGSEVLEDLDRDLGQRVLQPAPSTQPPTASSPTEATEGEAKAGERALSTGPRPAWVEGACDRDRYLCGVGSGATVADADAQARGELARIFVARVQAVQESFQSASLQIRARTGEQWAEAQSVSSHSLVSSDKVVRFSEVLERWRSPEGRTYSLAVIDRGRASGVLRDEIQRLDQQILQSVRDAESTTDVVGRYRVLRRAMATSAERAAKNGDLQVIDGSGVPPAVPLAAIVGLLDEAREKLRFAVIVSGDAAEEVRSCLEAALTERSYEFESAVIQPGDRLPDLRGTFDVRLEARIRAENLGQIGSSRVETAEAELVLKMVDIAENRTFATVRGSERASRPTFRRAVATAAVKICKKKLPEMMDRLDRKFSR